MGSAVAAVSNKGDLTMNYEEFMWLNIPGDIRWSIDDESSADDCCTDLAQDIILDLSAPEDLADGIYEGQFTPAFADPITEGIRCGGIYIKDGKFDPYITGLAVALIMAIAEGDEPHHRFIEALEWNGAYFELSMGS